MNGLGKFCELEIAKFKKIDMEFLVLLITEIVVVIGELLFELPVELYYEDFGELDN